MTADAQNYLRTPSAMMCILVTMFNRLFWRPLYAFGERRLRLG